MTSTELTAQELITSLRNCRETLQSNATKEALSVLNKAYEAIEEETTNFLQTRQQELTDLQQQLTTETDNSQALKRELSQLQNSSGTPNEGERLLAYERELQLLEEEITELKEQNEDKVNRLAETSDTFRQTLKSEGSSTSAYLNQESYSNNREKEDQSIQEVLDDPKARANILKLQLFRSLGLIVDTKLNQAFVCGSERVDLLPLADQEKSSNSDLDTNSRTQYIWERIGAQGKGVLSGG